MNSSPITFIENIVKNHKAVHAYIFLGGSDLFSAAKEMAMALNCLEFYKQNKACRVCSNCYKINEEIHPDLYIVKPDGASIKIEQIRRLQQQINYKLYEARFKIIILAEADKLTEESANSLLKALEEPLPQTVFILLATNEKAIPGTIFSRCQKLYFGGNATEREAVAEETLALILKKNTEDCLSAAEELEKMERDQLRYRLSAMMHILRDLLVFKTTGDEDLLFAANVSSGEIAEIDVSPEQILAIIDRLNSSLVLLDQNVNKKLLLENFIFDVKKIIENPIGRKC